ncbi:MAG: hypothetical protein ACPGC4_01195 [Litorivicinaceae bacterium]
MATKSTVAKSLLGGLSLALGSQAQDEERAGKNLLRKQAIRKNNLDFQTAQIDQTTKLLNLSYLPDELETKRKKGLADLESTEASTEKTRLENIQTRTEQAQDAIDKADRGLVDELGSNKFLNVGENGPSASVADMLSAGRGDLVLRGLNRSTPFLTTINQDGSETNAKISGLRSETINGRQVFVPIIAGGEKGEAPATQNATSDPNDPVAFFTLEQLQSNFDAGLNSALAGKGGESNFIPALSKSGTFEARLRAADAGDRVVKPAVAQSNLPAGAQRQLTTITNEAISKGDIATLRQMAVDLGQAEAFDALAAEERSSFMDRFREDNPVYYTNRPEFEPRGVTKVLTDEEKAEIRRTNTGAQADAIIAAAEAPMRQGALGKAADYMARIVPEEARKFMTDAQLEQALEGKRRVEPTPSDAEMTEQQEAERDTLAAFIREKAKEGFPEAQDPEVQENVQIYAQNGQFNADSLIRLSQDKGEAPAMRAIFAALPYVDKEKQAEFLQDGINLLQRGQTDLSAQQAVTMKTNIAAEERANRQQVIDVAQAEREFRREGLEIAEGAVDKVNESMTAISNSLFNDDFDISDPSNPITIDAVQGIRSLARNADLPANSKIGQEAREALPEAVAMLMFKKAEQNQTWVEWFQNWSRSRQNVTLADMSRLLVKNRENSPSAVGFRDPGSSDIVEGGKISVTELRRLLGNDAANGVIRSISGVKEF